MKELEIVIAVVAMCVAAIGVVTGALALVVRMLEVLA